MIDRGSETVIESSPHCGRGRGRGRAVGRHHPPCFRLTSSTQCRQQREQQMLRTPRQEDRLHI